MDITVQRIGSKIENNKKWEPIVGEFTHSFVERKIAQRGAPDKSAMNRIVAEAANILGQCLPPNAVGGREAGLVVGYVQSGKTLSFTTVAALARDNGFAAVIFLAGTAVDLKGQTERRLTIDLGLDEIQHEWRHFENPELLKGDNVEIEKVLRAWRNPLAASRQSASKRSALITVLKHHQRLENLAETLERIDLVGLPFLIIDDESDQASLNTKTSKNLRDGTSERSTTYDRILRLKAAIPHHTYLQYTATPQANLLIGIADVLSPSFAELVSPGEGYLGGKHFFNDETPLCIEIPLQQVPSLTNPIAEAPDTLQDALRFYLLGAAHHFIAKQKGNRSMMIHPSQKTAPHTDYKAWVDGLLSSWRAIMEQPDGSPVRIEFERSFLSCYESLRRTFPTIADYSSLLSAMPEVLDDLKVAKVNSNRDAEKSVKFNSYPYWILVGGQKLDRGFTVEGLTVTYMPRNASPNADTLQQRARFFGYKKSYEGLCRVFLLSGVMSAFENYVESEEFVRAALFDFRGKPLQEWKRDFILNRALNPTRPSIIGKRIERVPMTGGWVVPGSLFRDAEAVIKNKELFEIAAKRWKDLHGGIDAGDVPEFKDLRRDSKRNILIRGVAINDIIDFLLSVQIRNIDDSSIVAATVISLVKHKEDNGAALVDVILVGEMSTDGLTGRSLSLGGTINNLFVGENPKGAKTLHDLNYVGDRAIYTKDRVTLHLRFLKFKPDQRINPLIMECVPWFSIRLPADVARDCIIEEG